MPVSRKILGIGSLPPPRGGVSIFFERWIAKNRGDGTTVNVIDLNKIRRLNFRQVHHMLGAYDEIFINNLKPIIIIICKIIHPLADIVVVDHNESRYFPKNNYLRNLLRKISYKLISRLEVVSSHLVDNHQEFNRIKIVSSFFPPDINKFDELFEQYDEEIKRNILDVSYVRLVISAWRPVIEDSLDLYGLTTGIDLLTELINAKLPVRLFMMVGDPVDNEVWRRIIAATQNPAMEGRIFVQTGQMELWPLLRCADVMLRLTPTDGNSVSIHEAQWAGCEVVASDVVPRPKGVVTYAYGDRESLKNAVIESVHRREAI